MPKNKLLVNFSGGIMTLNFSNLSKHMSLFVKRGFFQQDTSFEDIEITRAVSFKDLSNAYKLVYNNFLESKYIDSNDYKMRIREFELDPDTITFIAKKDNKIIGVTSIIISSNLPSKQLFSKELEELSSKKVCEGSNWVIVSEFNNSPILTELLRCCLSQALYLNFNDFIAIVSVSHSKFFEFLGFEIFSEVRNYSKEIRDPVVLIRLKLDELDNRFKGVKIGDGDDLALLKHYYIENNPYFNKVEQWGKLAKEHFNKKLSLEEFLEIVNSI